MAIQIGGITRLTKSFSAHSAVFLDNLDRQAGLVNTDAVAVGPAKVSSAGPDYKGLVTLGNGTAVLVPHRSPTIDFLDEATGLITTGPAHGQSNLGAFNGGIYLPNGLVLLIPARGEAFVVINPLTRQITNTIAHGLGVSGAGRSHFQGAVLLFDDLVYTVPDQQLRIGRFDWRTMTFTFIGDPCPIEVATTAIPFTGGFVTSRGDLLMMPRANNRPVRFTLATLQFTPMALGGFTGGTAYNDAIAHPNRKIYLPRGITSAAPEVYDIDTNTWSSLPAPAWMTSVMWSGGFLARTGEVCFAPRSGQHFGFWNPVTMTWRQGAAAADAAVSNQFNSGGLLSNGKYLLLADVATNHRIYTPFSGGRPVPFETQMSRFFNGRA